MIFIGWLLVVGRLVGRLVVGWLVCRLVGCWLVVGSLVGLTVCRPARWLLVGWLLGLLVSWLVAWSIGFLVGWLLVWLLCCLFLVVGGSVLGQQKCAEVLDTTPF